MKIITDNNMRAAAENLKTKWAREDAKRVEKTITAIAKEHLDIETLKTRSSDELDFHDTAVWCLKAALKAAYEAGKQDRN